MNFSPVDKVVNESGMTELHLAAYNQDIEWVKSCLKDKFDINKKDNNGWTPLVWAIDMACTSTEGVAEEIITLLLSYGAITDLKLQGYTSLIEFSYNVHQDIGAFIEAKVEEKR